MIQIKGKYNTANVMINEIDQMTREQIQTFVNHPAFANTYIAIMPDCHAGKGAVIGFTMKMNDYIIPNIVGVDIGCGMAMARYNKSDVDLVALDRFIKANIPSGFHTNTVPVTTYYFDDIADTCERTGQSYQKVMRSMGTLGGGNHFIELGYSDEGMACVTVHTGSRNFGKTVADFYQKRAKEGLARYFIPPNEHKDLEFLPCSTQEFDDYLMDLAVAQSFASLNREAILAKITQFMGLEPFNVIESVHNFIGADNIIRKGATSANVGEVVIIPFNMRDGIAICEGRGCGKYNNSAPHGAGRIMSRIRASKELSVEAFVNTMAEAGIYTTTATIDTLDEAPDAYKPMDLILENIRETVDVVEMLRPVYNFKNTGR